MNDLKYNYAFIGYDEYNLLSLISIKDDVYINYKPWDCYNCVKASLCRLHLSSNIYKYIDLPFKNIWLRGITYASFSNDKPICFMLQGSYYAIYVPGLVDYIRIKYPKSKIVFHCTDKVEWYKSRFGTAPFNKLVQNCDLVFTYNELDAASYGFNMIQPVIPQYGSYENLSHSKESDILYVGRAKGREDYLHTIYQKATDAGLKCDFTIIGVENDKRLNGSNINYDIFLPYRTVVDKINSTKCILNIPQLGAQGLSLREYEAIGNCKYILSNNEALLDSPIVDKESVIFVDDSGNADYRKILTPLTKKAFIQSKISQYSWEKRLDWIDGFFKSNDMDG